MPHVSLQAMNIRQSKHRWLHPVHVRQAVMQLIAAHEAFDLLEEHQQAGSADTWSIHNRTKSDPGKKLCSNAMKQALRD